MRVVRKMIPMGFKWDSDGIRQVVKKYYVWDSNPCPQQPDSQNEAAAVNS